MPSLFEKLSYAVSMLHELFTVLALLLCGLLAILALNRRRGQAMPPYAAIGSLLLLSLLAVYFIPPVLPNTIEIIKPAVLGQPTGLKLGLWAQTQLPPRRVQAAQIDWLKQTRGGRQLTRKPIIIFRQPERSQFRLQGLQRAYAHRFGWKDARTQAFEPRAVIVHSTEGPTEASAFAIFDQNTREQYLGGIWTHFAVAPDGEIFQYGPLNRISKGQAGVDDLAVGIEIVGDASLWLGPVQVKSGQIIQRFQQGQTRQLQAVTDLIQTLQQHYQIPDKQIFSHEDVGNISTLRGRTPVDFQWLRYQIRDRVYLNLEPTINDKGEANTWYDFLEPYDRQDPGRDVMQVIYQRLRQDPHP